LRFVGAQRTIWWPDKLGWKTRLLFPNHPSIRPRNPNYLDGGSPGKQVLSMLILSRWSQATTVMPGFRDPLKRPPGTTTPGQAQESLYSGSSLDHKPSLCNKIGERHQGIRYKEWGL
jgi:hypothetical protein